MSSMYHHQEHERGMDNSELPYISFESIKNALFCFTYLFKCLRLYRSSFGKAKTENIGNGTKYKAELW